MAHKWLDFEDAAMALAGPYDLCTRQEAPRRFRWWLSTAVGWHRVRQGTAETMAGAKAAAEAAHTDHLAFVARLKPLSALDQAAILAAQRED